MAAGATDAACDATSRRMAAPGGLHIFGMKKGKWEGAHRSARNDGILYDGSAVRNLDSSDFGRHLSGLPSPARPPGNLFLACRANRAATSGDAVP